MLRAWLGTLLVAVMLTLPASAVATTYGSDALRFSSPDPFNVVAQQLTIVFSPPKTIWSLGGSFGVDAHFKTPAGSWSSGILTPFTSHAGVRFPAHTVFRQQPGPTGLQFKPLNCIHGRRRELTCINKVIPYARGDTYEILYGGSRFPYGPLIRDETLKFNVFTSLDPVDGYYPALGSLYDSAKDFPPNVCGRQRAGLARIALPVLNDYSLLGPPLLGVDGSQAEPETTAATAGSASLDRCSTTDSFHTGPSYGLAGEGVHYRQLPHVKFSIVAHWTPSYTRIQSFRPIHAAAPMYFEIDCGGKRCPFGSVRGRFGHLRQMERTVERRKFAPGDELFVFVGTSSNCGTNCLWGQQQDTLLLPRNRTPKIISCNYQAGPMRNPRYSCGKHITA